ncbi:MAG TPA: polysaccharide lyase family 7 protein [Nevskiaceae bacterium]|nr:polysaccharide lyase family 7 protein [Nevskiaceae bacterium]
MSRVLPSLLVVCFLASACDKGGSHDVADCDLDTVLPPNAGTPPKEILDLHKWSLTIPVDASGGTSGTADTVTTQELLNGYTSQWFYGTEDSGVAFWAPVNGARTPNSQYARSELRELVDPANESVNWFVGDDATMTAEVAVNRVPISNGNAKVIVGKIVQYSADNPDINFLMHLIYHVHANTCAAELYALVDQSPNGSSEPVHVQLIDDGLQLNHKFSYTIAVHQGALTITSGSHTQTVQINPAWNNLPVYFRAGAGLNTSGSDANDGAAVTIYSLSVTH